MNIYVNTKRAGISPGFKFDMERRLGRMYRKASHFIRRVNLTVTDVNGPKGGVDKLCKLRVSMFGFPSIVVITKRDTSEKAFVDALKKVNQTLFRRIKKHQRFRHKALLITAS